MAERTPDGQACRTALVTGATGAIGKAIAAWLATGPAGAQATGQYFEHQRQAACRFGADHDGVEALYQACERYG